MWQRLAIAIVTGLSLMVAWFPALPAQAAGCTLTASLGRLHRPILHRGL